MITAVDTNVISAFWSASESVSEAETLLLAAHREGKLVICGVVYAELLAHPTLSPYTLDEFLDDLSIQVEFELGKKIWEEAGSRFAAYALRRAEDKAGHPRRLVADFVIGAHAFRRGFRLLTLNPGDFRKVFPELLLLH